MDKNTINTYNKMAQEYDQETQDFWQRFPATIIENFIKNIKENKKVLDLGSGPGRDGEILKNNGLQVICLDASFKMIDMCIQKGLDAFVGDFLNIPFEDNIFGGVWAYCSLLHIKKEDFKKALIEVRRVLIDGGIFGIGLIEGEGEYYKESAGVSMARWFAFYTKEELESIFKEIGFEVLYFESFKPRSSDYLNYILKKV